MPGRRHRRTRQTAKDQQDSQPAKEPQGRTNKLTDDRHIGLRVGKVDGLQRIGQPVNLDGGLIEVGDLDCRREQEIQTKGHNRSDYHAGGHGKHETIGFPPDLDDGEFKVGIVGLGHGCNPQDISRLRVSCSSSGVSRTAKAPKARNSSFRCAFMYGATA